MYLFIILFILNGISHCGHHDITEDNKINYCDLINALFENDTLSMHDIEKIKELKNAEIVKQPDTRYNPCQRSLPFLIKFSERIISESQRSALSIKVGKIGHIAVRDKIHEDKLNALIESIVFDESDIKDIQKSYQSRLNK